MFCIGNVTTSKLSSGATINIFRENATMLNLVAQPKIWERDVIKSFFALLHYFWDVIKKLDKVAEIPQNLCFLEKYGYAGPSTDFVTVKMKHCCVLMKNVALGPLALNFYRLLSKNTLQTSLPPFHCYLPFFQINLFQSTFQFYIAHIFCEKLNMQCSILSGFMFIRCRRKMCNIRLWSPKMCNTHR